MDTAISMPPRQHSKVVALPADPVERAVAIKQGLAVAMAEYVAHQIAELNATWQEVCIVRGRNYDVFAYLSTIKHCGTLQDAMDEVNAALDAQLVAANLHDEVIVVVPKAAAYPDNHAAMLVPLYAKLKARCPVPHRVLLSSARHESVAALLATDELLIGRLFKLHDLTKAHGDADALALAAVMDEQCDAAAKLFALGIPSDFADLFQL